MGSRLNVNSSLYCGAIRSILNENDGDREACKPQHLVEGHEEFWGAHGAHHARLRPRVAA